MAGMDDFRVTEAKIAALVGRIVAAVDPQEVIVFGSQARGDARAGSDLDIAVIADRDSPELREKMYSVTRGDMAVDLLVFGREEFDRFRPWINTVERQIDREGVRQYVRSRQSNHPAAA
jgi:predicted nucleotidyltransferase